MMKLEILIKYTFLLLSSLSIVFTAAAQQNIERELDWYGFDEARDLAIENNKSLFLFFEAEWCGFCKQMRNEVFPDVAIHDLMNEHFYPVSIDLESESTLTYQNKKKTERSFSHLMRINATPTIIFMTSAGEPVGVNTGFQNRDELENLLIYVGKGFVEEMELEEFKNSASAAKFKKSN